MFHVLWLIITVHTSDLYPYTSLHGAARSERSVRECHAVQGRDEIFEAHDSSTSTSPPHIQYFTDNVAGSYPARYAYGHLATVSNPLHSLSFYEPGSPGSCSLPVTPQYTTSYTSSQHGCTYAANAGFFRTSNGNCLGNLVSDGRLAVDGEGKMNPNLGILKNGTIVTGYLTQEHVTGLEWQNLVQGIIWLVREGENYVEYSQVMECGDLQETGSMDRFVDVISARTAIGHDKEGNVLMLHVDGKTDARGVKLTELADLLITHGFVNAINLDGGGSASAVYNNTLFNYPSDHCEEKAYRCERDISAVVCVHPVCECMHGSCDDMWRCTCDVGYTGVRCEERVKCEMNCSLHGACGKDGCVCTAGYVGRSCHIQCPEGLYGLGCTRTCICTHGTCHHVTGACTCNSGWTGDTCTHPCPPNTWGVDCASNCTYPNCTHHGVCDAVTGDCVCNTDYIGSKCDKAKGPWANRSLADVSVREIGMLALLIGLIALSLLSISLNVYFYLRNQKLASRPSRGANRQTITSSNRSPKLRVADMTASEHQQRQIPSQTQFKEVNIGFPKPLIKISAKFLFKLKSL